MKKLMVAICAATTLTGFAADEKKADEAANKSAENTETKELTKSEVPIFWGFANYGWYSGYQLYGSLVNQDPTLQGYAEGNFNLIFGGTDFGYFGGGIWSNSDLTDRRQGSYRRAFNEWDFNIHWGKTFWFDDDQTVGLDYRTSVVWYWYPKQRPTGDNTPTTMDWNHNFSLVNPYLIPYINWVHEYRRTDGNLLQFGVKKPFQITDELNVMPLVELIWRDKRYGWCFADYGLDAWTDYDNVGAGLATLKVELDATYMFTDWIGVFAKVAYCQNLDPNLREACPNESGNQSIYGYRNEFIWGGCGICVNF